MRISYVVTELGVLSHECQLFRFSSTIKLVITVQIQINVNIKFKSIFIWANKEVFKMFELKLYLVPVRHSSYACLFRFSLVTRYALLIKFINNLFLDQILNKFDWIIFEQWLFRVEYCLIILEFVLKRLLPHDFKWNHIRQCLFAWIALFTFIFLL